MSELYVAVLQSRHFCGISNSSDYWNSGPRFLDLLHTILKIAVTAKSTTCLCTILEVSTIACPTRQLHTKIQRTFYPYNTRPVSISIFERSSSTVNSLTICKTILITSMPRACEVSIHINKKTQFYVVSDEN